MTEQASWGSTSEIFRLSRPISRSTMRPQLTFLAQAYAHPEMTLRDIQVRTRSLVTGYSDPITSLLAKNLIARGQKRPEVTSLGEAVLQDAEVIVIGEGVHACFIVSKLMAANKALTPVQVSPAVEYERGIRHGFKRGLRLLTQLGVVEPCPTFDFADRLRLPIELNARMVDLLTSRLREPRMLAFTG